MTLPPKSIRGSAGWRARFMPRAGTLDLRDVGAELGEQRRAEWASQNPQ
jgi:hypothetical protein